MHTCWNFTFHTLFLNLRLPQKKWDISIKNNRLSCLSFFFYFLCFGNIWWNFNKVNFGSIILCFLWQGIHLFVLVWEVILKTDEFVVIKPIGIYFQILLSSVSASILTKFDWANHYSQVFCPITQWPILSGHLAL